jgi:sulfite dehydrogenase
MRRIALVFAISACAAFACRTVAAGEESIHLCDAPAAALTSASCATCHSLDYIPMNAPVMNRASWEKTVHKMIDKFGAPIRPEDVPAILDYLTEHYSN